jgi:hypothetical protein
MSDVSLKDASLKGPERRISAKEPQVDLMGQILGWMGQDHVILMTFKCD